MEFELASTALHRAVQDNDLDEVRRLLDHGADPCVTNVQGESSLYFSTIYGTSNVIMALLNSDAGNACASIPTSEHDTALHECLRGGGPKMKMCVKKLVSCGADVSIHNTDCESPMHMVVMNGWGRDIIELLILHGRGMDFDRQHFPACTPLERVVYRPRPVSPSAQTSSVPEPEWDDSLALFFLQMGVTQERLTRILWYELNREEPGNRLLDLLMDSFAYLPSLDQLEEIVPLISIPILRLGDEILRESTTHKVCAQYAKRRRAIQEYVFLTCDAYAGVATDSPLDTEPGPHVRQKKEDYCRRRREIPRLSHLSRSTIRYTLKAEVRRVISLPVPTVFKEYILLGYKLGSRGQKDGGKKSVPSNSSSERGQPELSPSRA